MGKATREAYGNALAAVGAKNKNIVVLDADLSKSTKTNVFKEQFPDRFFNVVPLNKFAMQFAIQNSMLRYVLPMQALPLARMGLPTNPLKISLACGSSLI